MERTPATSAAKEHEHGDVLDEVELESALLVRNFELLRRRTDIYDDLDRSEYLLLRTLDDTGPADINTLAGVLGLDPSTAGRQVAAMQEAGLIERKPATDDRRRCIVTPTEEGERRAQTVRLRRHHNLTELVADWTEDEVRTLGVMFAKYNRAVGERFRSEQGPIVGRAGG